MFYKKNSIANEIEISVFKNFLPVEDELNINTALQSLAKSAEEFEALNLPEEAEVITQFLETIASGQFAMVKEAKKKAKKKSKKKALKKKTKDLDSKDLVKNLTEVGWVFNAPDCDDCNMADDVESDLGEPFWKKVIIKYGLGANGQTKQSTLTMSGHTVLETMKKLVKWYQNEYNKDITPTDGLESVAKSLEQKARNYYEEFGGTYHDGSFYFGFRWPGIDYETNCDLYLTPSQGKRSDENMADDEVFPTKKIDWKQWGREYGKRSPNEKYDSPLFMKYNDEDGPVMLAKEILSQSPGLEFLKNWTKEEENAAGKEYLEGLYESTKDGDQWEEDTSRLVKCTCKDGFVGPHNDTCERCEGLGYREVESE